MIPRSFRLPLLAAAAALGPLLLAAPAFAQEEVPTTLEGWVERHDRMVEQGREEAALGEARALVERDPRSPQPRFLLGRLLGNLGKVEEARVQFEGALELDIHYAPAWRGMAKVHLHRKEYETAVREAQKAFDIEPGNQEGRVLLVNCLYQAGERPRAYKLLQEELAKSPADADLRYFYASLLAAEGKSRDAEKELRVVLAGRPDHGPALETLVYLLASTGRPGEATDACREALRTHPDNPRLWVMLRDLRVQEGDFHGAVAAVEGLLKCELSEKGRNLANEDLVKLRTLRDTPPGESALPTYGEVFKMLESPDTTVRREGMRLLSEAELPYLHEAVVRGVIDPDEQVRVFAVRILGRQGDAGIAGLLSRLLLEPGDRDKSDLVRTTAAYALGRMAERGILATLPVLFRALGDDSPEVLRAGVQGIARVTGKAFVDDPAAPIPEKERPRVREEYRKWWEEHPTGKFWRRKAAKAVGEAGDRNLAEHLLPWLEHADAEIREAALGAFATLFRDESWRGLPTGTPEERAATAAKVRTRLNEPLPRRE